MSRYYDPVTHRFINADGYFQAGGSILEANTFAYCGNNAIMLFDPNGDHSTDITCGDPTCLLCSSSRRNFVKNNYDWVISVNPYFNDYLYQYEEYFNIWGFKFENTTSISCYPTEIVCPEPIVSLGMKDISANIKLNNMTILSSISENEFSSMIGFGDKTTYSFGFGYDADNSFICWDVTTNLGDGFYLSNTSKYSVSYNTQKNILIGATIVATVCIGVALAPETGGASAIASGLLVSALI